MATSSPTETSSDNWTPWLDELREALEDASIPPADHGWLIRFLTDCKVFERCVPGYEPDEHSRDEYIRCFVRDCVQAAFRDQPDSKPEPTNKPEPVVVLRLLQERRLRFNNHRLEALRNLGFSPEEFAEAIWRLSEDEIRDGGELWRDLAEAGAITAISLFRIGLRSRAKLPTDEYWCDPRQDRFWVVRDREQAYAADQILREEFQNRNGDSA